MNAILLLSKSIWTPRHGSWWRLPSWRDLVHATGELRYKSATGHLARAASGHLVYSCATTPCDFCVGAMGARATITISNWVKCGCTASGIGTSHKYSSGTFNGTYDIPQTSACRYSADVTTAAFLSWELYGSDTTCTTLSISGDLVRYDIFLTFLATSITLFARGYESGVATRTLFNGALALSAGYNCMGSRTITDSGVCDVSGSPALHLHEAGATANVTFS